MQRKDVEKAYDEEKQDQSPEEKDRNLRMGNRKKSGRKKKVCG